MPDKAQVELGPALTKRFIPWVLLFLLAIPFAIWIRPDDCLDEMLRERQLEEESQLPPHLVESHRAPIHAPATIGERSNQPTQALLSAQRQDAIKHVFRTRVLRDPDSASFSFQNSGANRLRVRIRHQNAFGGFVVQQLDVKFPPGSVHCSEVIEVK